MLGACWSTSLYWRGNSVREHFPSICTALDPLARTAATTNFNVNGQMRLKTREKKKSEKVQIPIFEGSVSSATPQGLETRLRGSEHWLFLHTTRVQFSTSAWWLTTIYNSRSRESHTLAFAVRRYTLIYIKF